MRATLKVRVFENTLTAVRYEGGDEGIRPSLKHRDKIARWPVPTNREELDGFLWLTPFLRRFIPGRAEHVLRMKSAYLHQVPAQPARIKLRPPDLEPCDEDLTEKRKHHKTKTASNAVGTII
jgi:hypothetical protein